MSNSVIDSVIDNFYLTNWVIVKLSWSYFPYSSCLALGLTHSWWSVFPLLKCWEVVWQYLYSHALFSGKYKQIVICRAVYILAYYIFSVDLIWIRARVQNYIWQIWFFWTFEISANKWPWQCIWWVSIQNCKICW